MSIRQSPGGGGGLGTVVRDEVSGVDVTHDTDTFVDHTNILGLTL